MGFLVAPIAAATMGGIIGKAAGGKRGALLGAGIGGAVGGLAAPAMAGMAAPAVTTPGGAALPASAKGALGAIDAGIKAGGPALEAGASATTQAAAPSFLSSIKTAALNKLTNAPQRIVKAATGQALKRGLAPGEAPPAPAPEAIPAYEAPAPIMPSMFGTDNDLLARERALRGLGEPVDLGYQGY